MYLNLSVEVNELCMFLVMETKNSIYEILAGSLVSYLVLILVTVIVIIPVLCKFESLVIVIKYFLVYLVGKFINCINFSSKYFLKVPAIKLT